MKKFTTSALSVLLALVILCSPLTGVMVAHAFDPSKDIYLDGTQDFLMAADVLRIMNEERAKNGLSAMTATIMTDLAAQGISFCTDGQVEMDITKYDLF